MKRIVLTLFILFITLSKINAQLPDDSVAPDFTITDLSGETHHLYEYLDKGKIVILSIFSTWCPPCWDYVNTETLQKMWDQYGPKGKKEVMVLLVEGDKMTNTDCITGEVKCVGMTQGNWVEAVNFPIAEDSKESGIAEKYEIAFYPSVYMIYPNRLLTQVGQVPLEELVEAKNKNRALVKKKKNNVAVINSDIEDLSCKEITPSFQFQNLGKKPLTSFQVELSVNGKVVQQETWSGNAETYDLIPITMEAIPVKEQTNVSVTVSKPNGKKDKRKQNNIYQTQTFAPHLTANNDLIFTIHSIGENNSVDIKILDENQKPLAEILEQKDEKDGVLLDVKDVEFGKDGCYQLLIEDSYQDRTFTDSLSVDIFNDETNFKTTHHHLKRGDKGSLEITIPFFIEQL